MRFMMLVIHPEGTSPPADTALFAEELAKMGRYNEDLMKAGVLLALDGLHPQSGGVRVTFDGGKATPKDGPFAEAKEVVGGYWLIQVKSKQEAVEWALRCPMDQKGTIEIRQVQELDEFPEDIQEAVAGERELMAELERTRAKTAQA